MGIKRKNPPLRTKKEKKKQGNRLKQKHIHINDHSLRKAWDKNLSIAQNLARVGYTMDPNMDSSRKKQIEETLQKKGLEKIELPGPLPAKEKMISKNHITPGEREVIAKLIKKYGDDYKKMSLDIKINTRQLSEGQLRKACEKYRRYQEEVAATSVAVEAERERRHQKKLLKAAKLKEKFLKEQEKQNNEVAKKKSENNDDDRDSDANDEEMKQNDNDGGSGEEADEEIHIPMGAETVDDVLADVDESIKNKVLEAMERETKLPKTSQKWSTHSRKKRLKRKKHNRKIMPDL